MSSHRKSKVRKKVSNQLEIDFTLNKGSIHKAGTQIEFDFFNEEHNFYCQVYRNKSKLQLDILRLSLADKIKKHRMPVRRILLFSSERTRQRVARANRSILKENKIETHTIKVLP